MRKWNILETVHKYYQAAPIISVLSESNMHYPLDRTVTTAVEL